MGEFAETFLLLIVLNTPKQSKVVVFYSFFVSDCDSKVTDFKILPCLALRSHNWLSHLYQHLQVSHSDTLGHDPWWCVDKEWKESNIFRCALKHAHPPINHTERNGVTTPWSVTELLQFSHSITAARLHQGGCEVPVTATLWLHPNTPTCLWTVGRSRST